MPRRADRDRVRTAVEGVAARADRTVGRHDDIWNRYRALTRSTTWAGLAADAQAVYANLVGVAVLRDAEDFLTLSSLARVLGHEALAGTQDGLDALLGFDEDLPAATLALRVMSDETRIADRLTAAGVDPEQVRDVVARISHHTAWLMLVGVGPTSGSREVEGIEQLSKLIDSGSLRDWRMFLGPIAANPWGPAGDRVVEIAARADLDVVARIVDEFRAVYRAREEERERQHVAREIRRLVAISGLTQREFAGYIGTSGSRLSTYVAGKVTPSAAMLLRIRRAAHTLRQRRE